MSNSEKYIRIVYDIPVKRKKIPELRMSLVTSFNPLASPTDLVVVPVGCYEEESQYAEKKFPSLNKDEITRIIYKSDLIDANYGDVVEAEIHFEYPDPDMQWLKGKQDLAFMIMPAKLRISYTDEINILRECCIKVMQLAIKKKLQTIAFVIYPDETTSLPILVRFHIIKQFLLEIMEEHQKECNDHQCPTDIDFRLDIQSIMNDPSKKEPSEEDARTVNSISDDLVWISKYDCDFPELMDTAALEPDAPNELKRLKAMFNRFPRERDSLIEKMKAKSDLRTRMLNERDEYIYNSCNSKDNIDFALKITSHMINEWAKKRGKEGRKDALTVLAEQSNRSINTIKQLTGSKSKLNYFPSRDVLISIAIAMDLDEEQRKIFVSCADLSMIYPFGLKEDTIEYVITHTMRPYKHSIKFPLDPIEVCWNLPKNYYIYNESRKSLETKLNRRIKERSGLSNRASERNC